MLRSWRPKKAAGQHEKSLAEMQLPSHRRESFALTLRKLQAQSQNPKANANKETSFSSGFSKKPCKEYDFHINLGHFTFPHAASRPAAVSMLGQTTEGATCTSDKPRELSGKQTTIQRRIDILVRSMIFPVHVQSNVSVFEVSKHSTLGFSTGKKNALIGPQSSPALFTTQVPSLQSFFEVGSWHQPAL